MDGFRRIRNTMSWVLCGILYISLQASGEIGLRDSIFSIFQLEDGQSRVIALTSQDQMVNACKEIFSSCSNRLRREVTNFLNSTAYDFVARKDETVATIKEGDTLFGKRNRNSAYYWKFSFCWQITTARKPN